MAVPILMIKLIIVAAVLVGAGILFYDELAELFPKSAVGTAGLAETSGSAVDSTLQTLDAAVDAGVAAADAGIDGLVEGSSGFADDVKDRASQIGVP